MKIVYSKCKRPNICKSCKAEFPNLATIDGVRVNLSVRHYCLDCSPYVGSGNRSRKRCDKYKTIDGVDHKWCNYEKSWVPIANFYVSKNGLIQAYCQQCNRRKLLQRTTQTKRRAVMYCGDKCADCGNQFPDRVYDFHHIDPAHKDFKLSSAYFMRWRKLEAELDKCVLLCSNCHRIRHASTDEIE